jgi:hypothetical protein
VVTGQLSLVQGFLSSQLTALPAQLPLLQASPLVQALASLHGVPSTTALAAQLPVLASQVFLLQVVSLAVLHVLTVLGSILHV